MTGTGSWQESLADRIFETHIAESLKQGNRILKLVRDLSTQSVLHLLEKAGSGKPRAKATAEQKQSFIQAHSPKLLQKVNSHEIAQKDLIFEWFRSRATSWAKDVHKEDSATVPWPWGFGGLQDPPSWELALFITLNAQVLESPVPERLSGQLEEAISCGHDVSLNPGLLEKVDKWYLESRIREFFSDFSPSLLGDVTHLGDDLQELLEFPTEKEKATAVPKPSSLDSDVKWTSVLVALGTARDLVTRRLELAFGDLRALSWTAEELGWPRAQELRDLTANSSKVPDGKAIGSLLSKLHQWLDALAELKDRQTLDLAGLLPALLSSLDPILASRDLALLRREANSFIELAEDERTGDLLQKQAPTIAMLAGIAPDEVDEDDPRWGLVEEALTFKSVNVLRRREISEECKETLKTLKSHLPKDSPSILETARGIRGDRPVEDALSRPNQHKRTKKSKETDLPNASEPAKKPSSAKKKVAEEVDAPSVADKAKEADEATEHKAVPETRQRQEPRKQAGQPDRSFFETKTTASEIVDYLENNEEPDPLAYEALAWRLVADDRLALAYHLATSASSRASGPSLTFLPHLLEAMSLGRIVKGTSSASAGRLRGTLARLQASNEIFAEENSNAESLRLALLSSLLRPALLARGTGAANWLRTFSFGDSMPALHELREAVLGFSDLGLELSPSLLKGVRAQAAWAEELEQLEKEAAVWLTRNRDHSMKLGISYQPARAVWIHWLGDDQELGQLIRALVSDNRKFLNGLPETLETWGHQKGLASLLHRTDRELRRGKPKAIEGSVIQRVYQHVQEALLLARKWRDLVETEPGARSDFVADRAQKCREELLRASTTARGELESFLNGVSDLLQLGCGRSLKRCLDDLKTLLDPDAVDRGTAISPNETLGAVLLRIPGLVIAENLQLEDPASEQTLRKLVTAAVKTEASWQEAFEAQLKNRNHMATAQILNILEDTGEAEATVDQLGRRREDHLQECRQAFSSRLRFALTEIEKSVSKGLLDEKTRASCEARVNEFDSAEILDFFSAEHKLNGLLDDLQALYQRQVEEIEGRLELLAEEKPVLAKKVTRALKNENLLAANEYLDNPDLANTDIEPDTQSSSPEDFRKYFPDFVKSATTETKQKLSGRELADAIRRMESVGPVDMTEVPDAQAKTAAEMLGAWSLIKDRVGSLEKALRQFFSNLGFEVHDVTRPRISGSIGTGELAIEPLANRESCPIPLYGSQANGRYRLMLAWGLPSEEELIQKTANDPISPPLIVLYLGRLSEKRRRGLARLQREHRRAFIVIDETLVLFLCMQRGYRPPVLFRTSLPFMAHNPYTVAAGLVPIEMFFGRKLEIESILDRFGTNLVFGGRQLGKTALLREVARRHHDPGSGQIVRWIDLHPAGIGRTRPPEDLLAEVAQDLHEARVLKGVKAQTLPERIKKWLAEERDRRIILLVDEADAFFAAEADANPPFRVVDALKGLMDETERRFKVVFAGLHDVQRTSRAVNSPLAHLGTPVCIGPLLDNGEWREADSLIRVPLMALGFEFESEDLPLSILSYTNYYPSLIQLFCRELLNHLLNPRRTLFDERESPPYVVTSEHIEEAYQSTELRTQISKRFLWTLDLDPRYRVLALRIALEFHYRKGEATLAEGFDIGWIQQQALSTWGEAFETQKSVEDFRIVLDEMVGLGVLRPTGSQSYTLRSSNLLTALGTEQRIEDRLLDATKLKPPVALERSSFRRSRRNDQMIKSPITASQESELLTGESGVAAIFGTSAGGLEMVSDFVKEASYGHELIVESNLASSTELVNLLASSLDESQEGLTIVLVLPGCPWEVNWIIEASKLLRRRQSSRRTDRVLFLGDSEKAWAWVGSDTQRVLLDLSASLPVIGLRPWTPESVERWLSEQLPGGREPKDTEHLRTVTGFWSRLLSDLAEDWRREPDQWRKKLHTLSGDSFASKPKTARLDIMPKAQPVLEFMANLGEPVTLGDLEDFSDDLTGEQIQQTLAWAEILHYVAPLADGRWELDEFVGRALELARKARG